MSTPPPVDLEAFRSAMRAAGIEDIVESMLELFTTEGPRGMSLIATAFAAGDLDALARAAHSLRSSAGNIRAHGLAAVLQKLENAATRGDEASAAGQVKAAETEHAAVQAYLADRSEGRTSR